MNTFSIIAIPFFCPFSGSVDSWRYQEEPSQLHRWRRVYGVMRG